MIAAFQVCVGFRLVHFFDVSARACISGTARGACSNRSGSQSSAAYAVLKKAAMVLAIVVTLPDIFRFRLPSCWAWSE